MRILQNTLYVLTEGAYLHRDHQTVKIKVEKQTRLTVPLHNLEGITCFGNVMVSPALMKNCAEAGISLTFLSSGGRLLARVDAPMSGNVLLRREQFRKADDPCFTARLCRNIVAGKLQNTRHSLLRSARDSFDPQDETALRDAAGKVGQTVEQLKYYAFEETDNPSDIIRGYEGNSARIYFQAMSSMIKQERQLFSVTGRSRRPPRDRTNCLLSFVYSLLLNDCIGALTAAGLDPSVGFLHTDRPGRPSLALDLMEEFRPGLADRFVLTLINRKQVSPHDFTVRDGGAVEMKDKMRKELIAAWQYKKKEELTHPLLGQKVVIGLLFSLQAKILARHIRGEAEEYLPFLFK